MELLLIRTYNPEGEATNGEIYLHICSTIELPWLENIRNHSCIPEGRYQLEKRFSAKHKSHLLVKNVPGRDGILIHPANDARTQLRGCIAPVTTLTAPGKGSDSKVAAEKLKAYLAPAFNNNENVYLTIKEQNT